MKKAYPFAFYLLYFAALASLMPFLVLYYQKLGLTGAQIGGILGISQLVSLVGGPFWTGIADSTGQPKRVMGLALTMLVGIGLVFPFIQALPARYNLTSHNVHEKTVCLVDGFFALTVTAWNLIPRAMFRVQAARPRTHTRRA